MTTRHRRSVAAAVLLASTVPIAASAEGFTQAQADAGKAMYNAQCSQCHGLRLQGVNAPALSDETMQNFGTAGGLYDMISVAMPPTRPGALGEEAYLNILAYILYFNGAQPGDAELVLDYDQLDAIDLVAATAGEDLVADRNDASAAASDPVPQAYTWGKPLAGGEMFQDGGEEEATAASDIPQAYTWGKELPTAN